MKNGDGYFDWNNTYTITSDEEGGGGGGCLSQSLYVIKGLHAASRSY